MIAEAVIEGAKDATKILLDDPDVFVKNRDLLDRSILTEGMEHSAAMLALVALIGGTWVADANDSR
jgi:hypothetical protein